MLRDLRPYRGNVQHPDAGGHTIERGGGFLGVGPTYIVIVLKDAAAVAIYGYKGINGAINIITKRGKYNTRSVKVSYDHLFTTLANKPKFVDGYTYGLAIN